MLEYKKVFDDLSESYCENCGQRISWEEVE